MKLKTQKTRFTLSLAEAGQKTGPELTIEPMSASEILGLLKKYRHVSYHQGTRQEEYDDLGLRSERFSRMVQDWKGLEDESGQPLPCTPETKQALCEFSPEFVTLVFEKIDQAQAAEQAALAESKKN